MLSVGILLTSQCITMKVREQYVIIDQELRLRNELSEVVEQD